MPSDPPASGVTVPVRLRQQWSPRRKYLVAVSGGADSVALLHLLGEAGYRRLVVVHLNHGLRGRESGADATFVRRLCKRLELPLCLDKTDVAKRAATTKQSLETAAREARLESFEAAARQERCRRIFVAHHGDDQAETVLMNLLRGCGPAGASGMKEVQSLYAPGATQPLTLIRPLLTWRRRELHDWLQQRGLTWREDSSNHETTNSLRNRLRNELLPALDQAFRRDVTDSLLRHAALAADERTLIEGSYAEELAMADETQLPVTPLRALPQALQRRVVHRWLSGQGISDCGLVEVDRVLGLIDWHSGGSSPTAQPPAKANLPGGRHVRRRAGNLFLE